MMHKKVVPDPDWDLSCARARGHSRDRAPPTPQRRMPRREICILRQLHRERCFIAGVRARSRRDGQGCVHIDARISVASNGQRESDRRETKESDRSDHFLVSMRDRRTLTRNHLMVSCSDTGQQIMWQPEKQ